MVVNPGLAGALYYLGVVLGRIAGGVVTNEQLALAVGILINQIIFLFLSLITNKITINIGSQNMNILFTVV